MRNDALRLAAAVWMTFAVTSAPAQTVAEIDFESVGRARPLAADLNTYHMTSATLRRASATLPNARRSRLIRGAIPKPASWVRRATARRRPASSRSRSTCSRRRTSTRIARSGAIRATSAATAPPRSRISGATEAADRRRSAGDGGVGLLRPRLSARGHRQPLPVQDGAGALRGVAGGDAEARRPDPAHLRHAPRRVDGPLPAARRARRTSTGSGCGTCRSRRSCRCSPPSTRRAWCRRPITTGTRTRPQWPSQYCWPEGFMRRWHDPRSASSRSW